MNENQKKFIITVSMILYIILNIIISIVSDVSFIKVFMAITSVLVIFFLILGLLIGGAYVIMLFCFWLSDTYYNLGSK